MASDGASMASKTAPITCGDVSKIMSLAVFYLPSGKGSRQGVLQPLWPPCDPSICFALVANEPHGSFPFLVHSSILSLPPALVNTRHACTLHGSA